MKSLMRVFLVLALFAQVLASPDEDPMKDDCFKQANGGYKRKYKAMAFGSTEHSKALGLPMDEGVRAVVPLAVPTSNFRTSNYHSHLTD